MIHFVVFWGDPESHLPVSRACTFFKCPLYPVEPRKLSHGDEIPTI